MNTSTKVVLAIVAVAAALGAFAFFGLTPFEHVIVQTFGSSPQGSTGRAALNFNIYGVKPSVAGANATSSSELNSTGQDLFVTGYNVGCTGVGTSGAANGAGGGLATLQMTIGTTSTAAPAAAAANPIVAAFTLATSSPWLNIASSTNGNVAKVESMWPNGTYMTFSLNATNTAVCTVGVSAISS